MNYTCPLLRKARKNELNVNNVNNEEMPIDPATGIALGMQAAGAVGQVFGVGNKRQVRQQARLNAEQVKSQKEMADYSFMKQMEMWNNTNYGAQVEHMKKAGLNPALLYGKGGGGGVTTGSGASTGVGGASAEGPSQAMSGMGQLGMMPAQVELIKAQTENVKADTANKAGVEPKLKEAQAASLLQGIENAKQQQQLTEVQTRLAKISEVIQGGTIETQIDRMEFETEKIAAEMDIAMNEAYISKETKLEKVKIVQEEAIGAVLKNVLTAAQTKGVQSGIEVNDATIKKMANDIALGWATLDRTDRQIAITKFKETVAANYPGILNVVGRTMDDLINSMFDIGNKVRKTFKNPE